MNHSLTKLFPFLVTIVIAACDCGNQPVAGCTLNSECSTDEICVDTRCITDLNPPRQDAGPVADAEPSVDAGGGEADVALPQGRLAVTPGNVIEFGAQRVGIPVTQTVILTNVGDIDVNLLQIVLDENETDEFVATPVGAINEALAPGASFEITVTHTPIDALADDAELKVIHDGENDGLLVVELFGDFKGQSILHLGDVEDVVGTPISALDFGAVPVGESTEISVYARNIGSIGSALVVEEVLITQNIDGFSTAALDASVTLNSFVDTCASLDECPAEAVSCDGLCRDENGAALDVFAMNVTFAPTIACD